MEKKIKISVAVTVYKRPKMVEDLIISYLAQDLKETELVLVDDCPEDQSVKNILMKYQYDLRIRFIKNEKNLGYCKNFLKTLTESKGEYIVVLGDDDIFLSESALSYYNKVFESNKDVGYIYCNKLQFNNFYVMDYVFQHYKNDKYLNKLKDKFQEALRSCYIPGIGLRNNVDFSTLYPNDQLLFPQVELIGKLVGTCQFYGISKYLVAGRAHSDQLGFAAITGKKIINNEKHSVYELSLIFDRIIKYYKDDLKINNLPDKKIIYAYFEKSHATIYPNEKINTNNLTIIRTFIQSFKNNYMIIFNVRYLFYFLIALILPKKVLFFIKEWYKERIIIKIFKKERDYFNSFIAKYFTNVI